MRIICIALPSVLAGVLTAGTNSTAPPAATSAPPVTAPAPRVNATDPIDILVAQFSNTHGLWGNGSFPGLGLPKTAPPEQVIDKTFQMTGFDKGHVKTYKVLQMRPVHIDGSLPDHYTAALVHTDLGEKIVLFKYIDEGIGWWSRIYDAPASK